MLRFRQTLIDAARLCTVVGGVSLVLLSLHCAYYNTFYNAQTLYQEGVKLVESKNQSGAKEKFEKAIKKSAVVIKQYPKSQWVDDALLLVAESYYYLGDYAKAIVKFENFDAAFPTSRFRDRARFYHALSLIGDGQYAKGITMLRTLVESSQEFREPAMFELANTALKRQEYDEAIAGLKEFVARFPRSRRRLVAEQLLAEAYFHEGDYFSAIRSYYAHRERAISSRDRFLDDLRIAECYLLLGQPDSTLAIIGRQTDRFAEYNERLNLLAGKAFLAKDKRNEAYASLAKVRSGAEGAEACLLMGKAYEQDTNLTAAAAYYDSAKLRDANSPYAREAAQRRLLIDRLTQLAKGTGDTAEARFLLAELYYLNLRQESLAMIQYQKVVDSFPKSPFAAKALYAIAWIRARELKSPDSILAWQAVIDRYPKTVYAQAAREVLGLPLLPEYEIEKPPAKRDTTPKIVLAGDSLIVQRAESLPSSGITTPESAKAESPRAERRRERSRERREPKPIAEEPLPKSSEPSMGTGEPVPPEPETPVTRPESVPPVAQSPSPETVRVSPPPGKPSVTGLLPVYFGFDRWQIRPQDTLILRQNLELLRAALQDGKSAVIITGYCDERGSEDYNYELGFRRARAVRDWLVARGLDARQVKMTSYGATLISYDNPREYWRERRCEFAIEQ